MHWPGVAKSRLHALETGQQENIEEKRILIPEAVVMKTVA